MSKMPTEPPMVVGQPVGATSDWRDRGRLKSLGAALDARLRASSWWLLAMIFGFGALAILTGGVLASLYWAAALPFVAAFIAFTQRLLFRPPVRSPAFIRDEPNGYVPLPVEIRIYRNGAYLGSDSGNVVFAEGWLLYQGYETDFSLPWADFQSRDSIPLFVATPRRLGFVGKLRDGNDTTVIWFGPLGSWDSFSELLTVWMNGPQGVGEPLLPPTYPQGDVWVDVWLMSLRAKGLIVLSALGLLVAAFGWIPVAVPLLLLFLTVISHYREHRWIGAVRELRENHAAAMSARANAVRYPIEAPAASEEKP